jgi:outer membrane protein TolC
MFPVRGPKPHFHILQSDFALWALLVSFLLLGTQAVAQQDILLTLAEAEDIALAGEPGRAALEAKAEALEHESVAAGELPDPTLRIGLANYPLESGGFTTEGMTQAQLGFRQAFPSGGTREAGTRRFEHLALEMRQSAATREKDVLTAVRNAWLDVYFWERAHAIVDESRPFFADMVRVTESLYSVGRKDQQDLLLADLELSRIDDRLLEINRQHMQAIATLSRWIGDDARRPIAEKFPAWAEPPDLQRLRAALRDHESLGAADARVAAMEAGVDFAEEDFKPGWAIDLGYGHRNGYLPGGGPRSDFVSLSVTMDLPYFRKNRQDRKLSAALSERRAAVESRDRLHRELASTLDAEYVRWQDMSRRIELYESRILGQAARHAEATLTAYQNDAGDFADVMRGYINHLNTRVEHLRLKVERAQGYAVLANLGGFSQ